MAMLSKKIAQAISLFVFLLLLLVGIFSKEGFALADLPMIGLKAFIGYVIFWLIAVVIADVVIKSILNAIETEKIEEWEGGMLTHFIPEKNEELIKTKVDYRSK